MGVVCWAVVVRLSVVAAPAVAAAAAVAWARARCACAAYGCVVWCAHICARAQTSLRDGACARSDAVRCVVLGVQSQ